ncbi:MAG: FxsA family protein, partial [Saccharopolyspora sp.]|nr:FxsA family protein [Saccharopolyspora sp.]
MRKLRSRCGRGRRARRGGDRNTRASSPRGSGEKSDTGALNTGRSSCLPGFPRLRRFAVPILLLLLAIGLVEISVLVLVGNAVGVLPTIGLLLAGGVLGSWLMRREGARTLRAFNEAAKLRRPPERELSDGVLIVAGGALIVLPGFVSDVLGLLCLLPPTRALLRRWMQRSAERRAQRVREQVRTGAAPGWAAPGWGAGFATGSP